MNAQTQTHSRYKEVCLVKTFTCCFASPVNHNYLFASCLSFFEGYILRMTASQVKNAVYIQRASD